MSSSSSDHTSMSHCYCCCCDAFDAVRVAHVVAVLPWRTEAETDVFEEMCEWRFFFKGRGKTPISKIFPFQKYPCTCGQGLTLAAEHHLFQLEASSMSKSIHDTDLILTLFMSM